MIEPIILLKVDKLPNLIITCALCHISKLTESLGFSGLLY